MVDYELLDSGETRRLERFGQYVLDRPDPEVLWKKSLPQSVWEKADAVFDRKSGEKGEWTKKVSIPDKWLIDVENLKFWVKLSPFKHTGIFPEQIWEWEYIYNRIKSEKREVKVLNLFAYTGVATMFAADAGAQVTHVDASRPAITWANENRELNELSDSPIRWIVDDALEFTSREIKRGVKYDAIIMDPPVYGHSPTGKPWDFSKDFQKLLSNCQNLLSKSPLFVLINAYAVSISPTSLQNTVSDYFINLGGKVDGGELTLKPKSGDKVLSTGIWVRWET